MPLQDKGKNIKDFNFYNNADEMKKSVLETACYFCEKDDVTVDDVGIGYVGSSNNIIEVIKRTKTLTRLIEVDCIINVMSWSYIFLCHLFSFTTTAC